MKKIGSIRDKYRYRHRYRRILTGVTVLFVGMMLWKWNAESLVRVEPAETAVDLIPLLDKGDSLGAEELTAEEYRVLFRQTGLGETSVRYWLERNRPECILEAQRSFHAEPEIVCESNSPISWEERIVSVPTGDLPVLTQMEDGDILITPCAHTFGWRNGHAALVVDAAAGKTLESAVFGQNSCIQNVQKWRRRPAFMVLRLKGADAETRARIAGYALHYLNEIPYSFMVGISTPKETAEEITGTQCAHLVWAAYRSEGYDLDSDGGRIVTPRDLACSPLLEVIQIYGMDPDRLWEQRRSKPPLLSSATSLIPRCLQREL